jgi:proline iminopeptidase
MRAALHGTELYFDVEGGELGMRDGALQSRRTIIALPGGPGFDHGYLRPGLSPLRADAQILYVDPRAHGRSGRPAPETWTLEQMADDVAALCALLGIAKPIVFGHSAGGGIALHLALRHPELLGGLILCDTAPTFAPIASDEPTPTLASRAPPDVAAIAGRFFGGDMSDEMLQAFTEKVEPYYAGPTHMDVPPHVFGLSTLAGDVLRHFFAHEVQRYDVRPELSRIVVETLVIVGRHDWVCPPRASRALASGIPNATLVILEESGHLGFAEEPEAFQRAMRSYLAELG